MTLTYPPGAAWAWWGEETTASPVVAIMVISYIEGYEREGGGEAESFISCCGEKQI